MRTESLYKTAAGEQAIMTAYDAALAKHWPAHETRTVPTRHGDTFVVVSGAAGGLPLVLLHGAGSNSAVWAGDATVLGKEHRIYAIDLIGEPGRSAPARPPWEGPAFGEWLADALDVLGLARTALLGISQGGWTALRFATLWPERVERLALLAPGGVVADRGSFLLRAVGSMLVGKRGAASLQRAVMGDVELPPDLAAYLALISAEFKPRIGKLPIFTDEELARLTMPVLLIGGEKDVIRDNAKIAARLKGLLPRLETVIVPGAPHALVATTQYTEPFLR